VLSVLLGREFVTSGQKVLPVSGVVGRLARIHHLSEVPEHVRLGAVEVGDAIDWCQVPAGIHVAFPRR
jgi:deazaflavin-dependent oxidoreductase (nitroreductase family)